MEKTFTVTNMLLGVPSNLIKEELGGLYGANVLRDLQEVISLYQIYEGGVDYTPELALDYTPADLRYRETRALIDKIARFMFSRVPDFWVDVSLGDSLEERSRAQGISSVYQSLVDRVLEENQIGSALVQAAKDCFIGKRVALICGFNENGIQVSFLPSLEFVYDVDPSNYRRLNKIIAFYGMNDEKAKVDQRIYRKKYWMKEGFCWYNEAVYDGLGNLVEEIASDTRTLFEYIPAVVIVNDPLTGDLIGTSEVNLLKDYESWYSRLAAADMDAERKGMNPIRYTIDASPESTQGLSISAGAFWDISSDTNLAENKTAQVGVLDSPMSYSSSLATTLMRIKNSMYEQTAVPNVTTEALQGVVSSGKTLQAIYWDLVVRCDEKMTTSWKPALTSLVKFIIEGVRLYPNSGKPYIEETLPEEVYSVRVDNQYALPQDEQEEKQIDLSEVASQTMSRKAYMKKWRNLTEEEIQEELQQMALERAVLEEGFPHEAARTSEKEDQQEEEEIPIE